jgi:hypothetical protein
MSAAMDEFFDAATCANLRQSIDRVPPQGQIPKSACYNPRARRQDVPHRPLSAAMKR